MRKVRFILLLLLCVMLVACAGLQAKWNLLTPDEKARIIISDMQGQLTNAFDTAKAYVASKPELQDQWKSKIIPAFDVANKAIASVILVGKTKSLTPELVYGQAQAQVTNVLNLLIQLGAIKK